MPLTTGSLNKIIKEAKKNDDDEKRPNVVPRPPPSHFDKLTMKLLNLYLEKKWHPDSRMIDLSELTTCDDLAELVPNLNNNLFCSKLAHCIAEGKAWAQSLDSLNLAENEIYTLKHLVNCLTEKNVKLQNIALCNNKIRDLKEVDYLVQLRLREVMLSDNPIAKLGDEYHEYVVKKLRTIELLDTISVKEWRKKLLPSLPEPQDSCFANQEDAGLVFSMCSMFFKAIDDRNFDTLVDAYDNEAFFTQSTERSCKIHTFEKSKNYHGAMQFQSHNLILSFCERHPTKNVYRGRAAIVEFLRAVVYKGIKTTHDHTKFKADAITMGNVIVVNLHGEVKYKVDGDTKTEYTSCFDRVMVLKPNKSGTEWPARIANDMLSIRSSQEFPMLLPEVDVKVRLRQVTGLNDMFASILLKEANSNFEAAVALFNQNKSNGSIPPDAFA